MKKLTTGRSVAFMLAGSLMLAACGGGGDSSSEGGSGGSGGKAETNEKIQTDYNEKDAKDLKEGGTVRTALTEISPQFNPFQQDGTLYTSNVWRWYNPVLSTYSPDGNEVIWNENYVTDVKGETKDGKTTVTYTVNPKAVYNDGTPIDVKAFENTWKANQGKDKAYLPSSTDGYSEIESVKAGKDDREVVVTFKKTYAWWEGLFGFLLHPKVKSADDYNKSYVNKPRPELGAGPYIVDKFDEKGGTISFKRNPKWWGEKGKLDSRMYVVMESQASLNAFKNGQLDATGVGTKDRLEQVKSMKNIDIRRGSTQSNSLLTLNGKSPLLKDIKVRQAIVEGLDRSQLAKIKFNGLNYSEPLPGSFMLYNYQQGYEDNMPVKFDADKANKDLDAAGWTKGSDGIRTKGGEKLTLNYVNLGDDPTGKAMATAFSAMMKKIGVEAKINQRPASDFSKVIQEKDFDLFMMGFASSDPYGVAYACQIWCSDSGLNQSSTADPKLDPELKALAQIEDKDEQIAEANKLEKKALARYGIVPLTNGPTITATKKGLANYGASGFYSAFPEDLGWEK